MATINRVPVADLCSLWAQTPTTPMNIALIGVLDQVTLTGGVDSSCEDVLGRVRTAVQANLHRAPLLRQVIRSTRRGEGRPVWLDDADFDLRRHVVLPDQAPPPGDDEAFLAWCARRSVIPVDPARPMWRMDVVPGLPGGRLGVLVVLHHVVADGLRDVQLVSTA